MSELKATHVVDVYEEYSKTGDDDAAQVYIKSEADKVIADLEESHKKEVGQLLIEIAELKKERDWLAKDRALAYNDLEKRAQLNIQKDSKICRLKKALYKACANWARSERYTEATWHDDEHREELWANVQAKCLKKADDEK